MASTETNRLGLKWPQMEFLSLGVCKCCTNLCWLCCSWPTWLRCSALDTGSASLPQDRQGGARSSCYGQESGQCLAETSNLLLSSGNVSRERLHKAVQHCLGAKQKQDQYLKLTQLIDAFKIFPLFDKIDN